MARKDLMLRLHERLIAKRDTLRRKLGEDFEISHPTSGTGDVGDAAIDGESEEMNTQLAALGSRELNQVERAIHLIRIGRYGTCEMCDKPIPVERLNALPFTPLCVNCQRIHEESGRDEDDYQGNWESAYEHEGRLDQRELSMGDIDVD